MNVIKVTKSTLDFGLQWIDFLRNSVACHLHWILNVVGIFCFLCFSFDSMQCFRLFSFTENHSSLVKNSPSSLEHGNPIISDKPQLKLHAQKRGGNQIHNKKKYTLPCLFYLVKQIVLCALCFFSACLLDKEFMLAT